MNKVAFLIGSESDKKIVDHSKEYFEYFGILYFLSSSILGIYYVFLCYKLLTTSGDYSKISKKIFFYSILYLFLIFSIILIDNIIK